MNTEEGDIGIKDDINGEYHQAYQPPPIGPIYPPPPYFPPPGLRFETRTERGLKFINRGLWLLVPLFFMSYLIIAMAVSNVSLSGFFIFFAFAGMFLFILTIAIIVLFAMGFINMFSGREEYGPMHAHKMNMALIFVILYIATSFATTIYSFAILNYLGPGPDVGDARYYSSTGPIIYIIFSFVATLFWSLTFVFLIIELASHDIKFFLWLAFGLNLLITMGSLILGFTYGPIGSGASGLGIIVLILVLYCYWRTYNRVKNREIKPIFPPGMPPPMFPSVYPPMYPQRPPPRL